MKIKILTADPAVKKWKTWPRKKREILSILNSGKNANFIDIDVGYGDISRPDTVINKIGRAKIKHSWINAVCTPYFEQGYDFVVLLYSGKAWWEVIGLPKRLRGANIIDKDVLGEIYMWADETTTRRYARGKKPVNQLIQVVIHEIIHEYFRGSNLPDVTHQYHYTDGDIRRLASKLDWALYRPRVSLLRKLEQLVRLLLQRKNVNVEKPLQIKKMHTTKYYELKEAQAIIAHTDLGTEKGTINEILNGTRSASYHWYIPRHGKYVIEFVPQEKGAWHAGVVHQPQKDLGVLLGGANKIIESGEPNRYSYGICYEGRGDSPTTEQIATAKLLLKKKGIDHLPIIAHWQVTSYKPKIVSEFVDELK